MKWLHRGLVSLALLVALIIGGILGIGWFIAPQDELQRSDAIIVVSGGDNNKRTDKGVELWKADWAPKLIFSGAAADQGISNAEVMRQRAVASGVPVEATVVEGFSRNTRENAELLKPILLAQNIKRTILVSSPYHTRRVKVTFEKVYGPDFSFIVHPATDSKWARKSWWTKPDTISLTLDELRKTLFVAFLQR